MKLTLIKGDAVKSTKSTALIEILKADGWKEKSNDKKVPKKETKKEPNAKLLKGDKK